MSTATLDRPITDEAAPARAILPIGAIGRRLAGAKATLLVLAVSGVVTLACSLGQQSALARHMTFSLSAVDASPYVVLTNGFFNPQPMALAIWAVGILLFGLMVERNAGSFRVVAVALTGAAGGVGGWWLFNTPRGLEIAQTEALRVFLWLFEHRGPDAATAFLEGWGVALRHLTWSAPVFGGAGVCGALLGYAAFRRRLHSDDLAVRPVKFLLAVVFLGVVVSYAWPNLVSTAFPYAMLVGGILAGVALIVPEKAIRYALERYWESR